jgi:hypothetical protein
MVNDRVEMTNLSSAMPDKVKDMAAKWEAWAKRCNVDTNLKK